MKKLRRIGTVIFCILLWTVFIVMGFIEGYLLRSLDDCQSPDEFFEAAKSELKNEYVGNLAMAMIEGEKVTKTYYYSHNDDPIDAHSAFPVASISKWLTAVGILKLVEAGKINLDKPVENYLSRWHLPASEFDNNKVTVRRLLSHSAGFEDQLGYNGFDADEEIQSLEESLTQAADAGSWTDGIARVDYEPGGPHMYSGASYTLLQLLIEEVTQLSFEDYMQSQIFEPLGMTNSSFMLADSTKIGLVEVYKTDSTTRPMKRFTAKAAAGLITSVDDLSKFVLALIPTKAKIISAEMIEEMRSPQSYKNGHAFYGLGPRLYGHPLGKSRTVGHDGGGNDAINAAARMDIETNSGIIILETGNFSYASNMADEWLFWEADIADRVVMQRNIPYLLTLLVAGYAGIIGLFIWFFNKKTKTVAA